MPTRLALIILSAVLAPALAARAANATAESATRNKQSEPSAIRNPQSAIETVHVAVLDMGASETARRVTERVAKLLAGAGVRDGLRFAVLDRDMSRAAAHAVGYSGSLNLTLAEARNVGAAVGCDFYIAGDAQTIRRSSSARPTYFESYASLFFVSTRTGRLVLWDRPVAEADRPERAESSLLALLDAPKVERYAAAVAGARDREMAQSDSADEANTFVDISTDEGARANGDLREPAPYKRIHPAYTDAADRAEAEATVDAVVEIGTDGEVARVEIVRWAGFGLDDSVASTIRQMHFRPAMRDGEPVPVRVLLRYNFRKPPPKKD